MTHKDKAQHGARHFFIYHLPVIMYGLVIIIISSLSYIKTDQLRFLAFDKIAHFLEYAIFALLAFRSFSHLSRKLKLNSAFIISILFLILFATFDEYFVQSLSRRNSSIYDLLADVIGATIVLLILRFYKKNKEITEQI